MAAGEWKFIGGFCFFALELHHRRSMATEDATQNPDTFKAIKRRLRRSLLEAFKAIAFAIYYPDCDVLLQVRNGKYTRLEIREADNLTT